MLKKVLTGLAALVAALLVVIATRPARYEVVRTTHVAAPPAELFAQVVDFHRWEGWSPWAKIDPNLATDYGGQPGAVGSSYHWSGEKTGEGRMTILEVEPPERVRIKLEFLKPFAGLSTTTFTFSPSGTGCDVSWRMAGDNDFMGKAMSLFGGMDRMVGPDFEKGLAKLKAVAEAGH
jgi:uncharacterized protein YndB with AHSA1/START domain